MLDRVLTPLPERSFHARDAANPVEIVPQRLDIAVRRYGTLLIEEGYVCRPGICAHQEQPIRLHVLVHVQGNPHWGNTGRLS